MKNKFEILLGIFVLVICIGGLIYSFSFRNECNKKQGVVLRSDVGLVCVDRQAVIK